MRALLFATLVTGCGFRGQAISGDGAVGGDAPRAIDASAPVHDGSVIGPDALVITADASVDAGPLACPITTGWVTIAGGHYYFSPDGDDKHWSAAESDCEQRGSGFSATHLAVIGSLQEGIDVGGHLVDVGQAVGGVAYAWIGAFQPLFSSGKSAGWLAITGGSAYLNWANGEPSDGGNLVEVGAENFAQLYQPGNFNDVSGSGNLHYICECDGLPADGLTALLVPLN